MCVCVCVCTSMFVGRVFFDAFSHSMPRSGKLRCCLSGKRRVRAARAATATALALDGSFEFGLLTLWCNSHCLVTAKWLRRGFWELGGSLNSRRQGMTEVGLSDKDDFRM